MVLLLPFYLLLFPLPPPPLLFLLPLFLLLLLVLIILWNDIYGLLSFEVRITFVSTTTSSPFCGPSEV